MWDIILESIRAIIIGLILVYIWKIGHARDLSTQKGWGFIISGWSLVLFGSVLDITDNFENLNWLIFVGDTEVEAFLENFVGFLVGYILLFIGFIVWLPTGARKINAMKSEFISTVSHELRTPLASIYGSLKLVTSGTMGEISLNARNTLDIALRNSERLTHIINDILDIEKLENGKIVFKLKPQEITKLVIESIEANSHYGETYQIQYALNQDSVSAMVNVDADRIIQIMNNLLSNAAKFSYPNSTVDINVSKQEGRIRVAVKDKGIGIDEKLRPLIFQKFTQADSTDKRHSGGTGLGLAIAKGFVEQMGGKIGFSSEQGLGTTFYFDLPEAQAAIFELGRRIQPS